jgi:hypothetical protein
MRLAREITYSAGRWLNNQRGEIVAVGPGAALAVHHLQSVMGEVRPTGSVKFPEGGKSRAFQIANMGIGYVRKTAISF